MSERITMREFHEKPDVSDWRIVADGAAAYFRTSSYRAALDLVAAFADVLDTVSLHPDIDVRPDGVTVRLRGDAGFSTDQVDIAKKLSSAAAESGAIAEPANLQTVQLTLDASVSAAVMPFWSAVLGYEQFGDEDVIDGRWRGPSIWFQPMDTPRTERNRIHVDVFVPPEQGEARLAAALAAGGHLVRDKGPTWWTVADAEGNEVDIATMAGRD